MVRRALFATTLLLFSAPALAEQAKPPAIAGYVTAVTSAAVFDVNGTHVRCTGQTQLQQADAKDENLVSQSAQDRYIGQAIDIYGSANKKTHTIVATKVIVHPAPTGELSGTAIIDHIPADSTQAPGEHLFSADGYSILITPKTQTTFTTPLSALTDVETNVWIKYTGKQRADGVLVADTAVFTKNVVPKSEDKLRSKNEYDPKSVDPSSKQGAVSKHFLGVNPKKIPPYTNAEMQARIDRIGLSLIPAYQRNLADADPTKIDFRFHLIDQPKLHDAWTLPNGIILVPHQVVERLQNDSQLATVLANGVASAIEKQAVHDHTTKKAMDVIADASYLSGIGEIAAAEYARSHVNSVILRHEQEQSGRVSLVFLRDAGYDIHEAPKAWWLLAPKKPGPMIDTPLPERAAYLYQTIGTTWRSTSSTNVTASE